MTDSLGGSVPGVARSAQCGGVREAFCRHHLFQRRKRRGGSTLRRTGFL
jgi:hypothetical protein